jgi:hypothetical protein
VRAWYFVTHPKILGRVDDDVRVPAELLQRLAQRAFT